MLLTVYIDGRCPLCVAGALRFRRIDTGRKIRFVDLHDPKWAAQAAVRFRPGEMAGSMRAQMPDGTWRTGWFAWATVLKVMPATCLIGRIMLWPVFYGIGPRFYRWVAAHRQALSRALHLPPPCDEKGTCRLN